MPEPAARSAPTAASAPLRQARLDGVERIVAVSSCKGGVGKSTVAVNLATALQALGLRVGLADVDIYGPSAPMMLGITGRPRPGPDQRIPPMHAHGLQVMSMGFFLDDAAPVIWRGPMAMSATKQFLRGVSWTGLDYLVIDLPPGTGDIVLTLAQEVPLDGAVIVTTPQDLALADVKRGIAMFRKVSAPVLGVIENMSGLVCSACGNHDPLFGSRNGEQLAAELGIPLLGEIPIEPVLRESGDAGTPIVVRDPKHAISRVFLEVARRVRGAVDAMAAREVVPEPVDVSRDDAARLLRIRWSDGVTTEYAYRGLRGWCPCASCQGHSGGRQFIATEAPMLVGVEGVGRYALRLVWADGHGTGMYPHAYLREIAEFRECRPA
jgi:ATP-binding protein involved in chromosome partitioning